MYVIKDELGHFEEKLAKFIQIFLPKRSDPYLVLSRIRPGQKFRIRLESDPQHLALPFSVGGKTTYNVRMHPSLLFFFSSLASENVFSIVCKLGFRKHCIKKLNKTY